MSRMTKEEKRRQEALIAAYEEAISAEIDLFEIHSENPSRPVAQGPTFYRSMSLNTYLNHADRKIERQINID